MPLVVDSGCISFFSERTLRATDLRETFIRRGLWPPVVPSPVLIECLQGHAGRDAGVNWFLKTCDVLEVIDTKLVRRAARLRTQAGRGSAVDALVIAAAEPGGIVLTTDYEDMSALATHSRGVGVVGI